MHDLYKLFPYATDLMDFQFALREYGEKCRANNATHQDRVAEHNANVKVIALYNNLLTKCQQAGILPK